MASEAANSVRGTSLCGWTAIDTATPHVHALYGSKLVFPRSALSGSVSKVKMIDSGRCGLMCELEAG